MKENYLIFYLAISDLMTGISSIVVFIYDYILQTVYKRWEDIYTCRVHNAMINIPTTASLLSLLALAMDRFVFIKYGLYYPDILPIQRMKIVIVIIWMISLTHALALAMPWTYSSADGRTYCSCMIANDSSDAYIMVCAVLYTIMPIIVIIILYSAIILEAVKYRIKIEDKNRSNDLLPRKKNKLEKIIYRLSNFWTIRGLPGLTFLVALTTIFWLPLSCGMVAFFADHNYE